MRQHSTHRPLHTCIAHAFAHTRPHAHTHARASRSRDPVEVVPGRSPFGLPHRWSQRTHLSRKLSAQRPLLSGRKLTDSGELTTLPVGTYLRTPPKEVSSGIGYRYVPIDGRPSGSLSRSFRSEVVPTVRDIPLRRHPRLTLPVGTSPSPYPLPRRCAG